MDRGSQLDEEHDKDDKEDEEDEEERRRRRRTRQEEATDIKSNNPHLAGGELKNVPNHQPVNPVKSLCFSNGLWVQSPSFHGPPKALSECSGVSTVRHIGSSPKTAEAV